MEVFSIRPMQFSITCMHMKTRHLKDNDLKNQGPHILDLWKTSHKIWRDKDGMSNKNISLNYIC